MLKNDTAGNQYDRQKASEESISPAVHHPIVAAAQIGPVKFEGSNDIMEKLDNRLSEMSGELHKIRLALNRIASMEQTEKDEVKSEWIIAAIVVERFCFVLFCTITIVFTAFFFLYGYSTQVRDYVRYEKRNI